jgi:hypothetical protein
VHNPKAVGEVTEAVILAHLLRRGDAVLLPFGNNQRYDLVIDRDGTLMKAQCKTGRLPGGVVKFAVHSTNGFTGATMSYQGQVDLFLVWCPELDKVYEVPADTVGTHWVCLRVSPSRQRARVRQAPAYEC